MVIFDVFSFLPPPPELLAWAFLLLLFFSTLMLSADSFCFINFQLFFIEISLVLPPHSPFISTLPAGHVTVQVEMESPVQDTVVETKVGGVSWQSKVI